MKGKALLMKGVASTFGLAISMPALADARQDSWGHHGMMWNGGMHWIMGPIMMLLFLVVVVAAVALVIRWTGGSPHAAQASSSPARRILEERFARGEIDEDEFHKKKKALDDQAR